MTENKFVPVIPSLGISVTHACQMDCIYCPPNHENIFETRSLCDPARVCDVLSAAASLGCKVVRFTGGEPLLEPQRTLRFLETAIKVRIDRIILNTNGVRLQDELSSLIPYKNQFVLIVSLDSVERETFRRITKLDACERVVAGIIAAKKSGLQVRLNMVLTTENINHLPEVIAFAEENRLDIKVFDVFNFGGVFQTQWNKCFANIDGVISYLQDKYEPTAPQRLPGERGLSMLTFKIGSGSQLLLVQHHGASSSTRLFSPTCSDCPHYPCACGRFQIAVRSDGIVGPCRLRNDLGVSIEGKSYPEIVECLRNIIYKEFSSCRFE